MLVDEYQDTNHAQYRWLQLLASEHRNLAVVGDDAQSIYGFRGADIRNILDFEEDFPDAHVVKLEQNYRSTQTILSAANGIVANNRGRMSKALWTGLGDGDPIRVRELADEHAEARFVAADIERMVDEGVSREEIAVFYRTNAQSRVLEDMLVRAQIGYQVIGGTKFYERAEIKDAIAYLIFLSIRRTRAPSCASRTRRSAGLARPRSRGCSPTPTRWGSRSGRPPLSPGASPGSAPPRSKRARALHVDARAAAGARRGRRPRRRPDGGDAARDGLPRRAGGRAHDRGPGPPGEPRGARAVAREYDATAEEGSPGEFLQQIALLADADGIRDDEGLVTLMTMHNAKGLEYPIVFMIGMEDGVFPHSRALDEGGLEEERRLAYVGVTRAMRDLTLTYARRRNSFGANSLGMRSRFIDEIPRELTDQPDPSAPGGAFAPGRVASWANAAASSEAAGAPARARAAPDSAGAVFHTGDDVVHAAFGEGVVTGTEPGGIVVVRFAGDGSERKLMADYAPIRRR